MPPVSNISGIHDSPKHWTCLYFIHWESSIISLCNMAKKPAILLSLESRKTWGPRRLVSKPRRSVLATEIHTDHLHEGINQHQTTWKWSRRLCVQAYKQQKAWREVRQPSVPMRKNSVTERYAIFLHGLYYIWCLTDHANKNIQFHQVAKRVAPNFFQPLLFDPMAMVPHLQFYALYRPAGFLQKFCSSPGWFCSSLEATAQFGNHQAKL